MPPFDPFRIPDDVNPYAPPNASLEPVSAETIGHFKDVETVRRTYFGYEIIIKALGWLHYVGSIVGVGSAVCLGIPSFDQLLVLLACLLIGTLGYGLCALRSWARLVETVLVGLTILINSGFVFHTTHRFEIESGQIIFTLIGYTITMSLWSFILLLLLSEKGDVVFSTGYRKVIAQTTHFKHQTDD